MRRNIVETKVRERVGELAVDQLRQRVDPSIFHFESTEELEALREVIGQDRAVRAISFGIDIHSPGYHIFAMGPAGVGKMTTIRQFLERAAADEPVPDDWLYVNNFEDSDKPRSIRMPAGQGCAFENDMEELVEDLKRQVPQAFDGEDYEQERDEIQEKYQKRRQSLVEELENEAQSKGFTLVQSPRGILLAPIIQGQVVTPEQFEKLDDNKQQEIERHESELESQLRGTMNKIQQLQQEAKEEIRQLDREVVGFAVDHLINALQERYSKFEKVVEHLDAVRADIMDNVEELKQWKQMQEQEQVLPAMLLRGQQPSFDKYLTNLIVDNCETEGAPVIVESNPSFQNLVGRIEHQAQLGALVTNYMMIKPGSLHRANGGYLMVDARDLLLKPFAYQALKRALKNQEVEIESMGQEYQVIATRTLEPDPIPLDIKVVIAGDPMLYYALYQADPDFQELFKVKADFAVETDRNSATAEQYAQFIGNICRQEGLMHFAPSGVARMVEHGSRMVSHQKKVATKFGDLVDLIRESSYWAGKNGNAHVEAEDVKKALDERIYRSNRLEKRIQELIDEGTILIDTEGAVAGQVNGLSVMPLGDYMFGKPSRITATVHVGSAGVVNIDRETELGGPIHNKGVMILSGYLGSKYAQDVPMALSASLTFEQLYQPMDGDSASSTELYALLSALAEMPIRQDLAVTGSVNQQGTVQAIGGVNEKIEGYFEVCKQKGLTGRQGVLIPASNVKHLMLRDEVVESVKEGRFHIYPISTIDEGISLLTGVEAGERQPDGTYPEGTVNRAVEQRLRELAEKGRKYASSKEESD
jgi:lon-related putative ATP-dependent protease